MVVESLFSDAHWRAQDEVVVGSSSFLPLNAVSLNAVGVMAGLHGDLEKMSVEGEIEK